MTRYATASGLWLMDVCAPAYALPRAGGDPVVGDPDPHAALGTVKHAYLADVLELGVDAALARVPEAHREACARLPVEDLPASQPGSWAAEVALAHDWDADTGRELGRRMGRRYPPLGETEIAGTEDLEGLAADGETVISADYKSGFWRVERAADNWQIRWACLASARTRGRQQALGRVIYCPEDADPIVDEAFFGPFELALIAAEIRVLCETVDDLRARFARGDFAGVEFTTGRHCAEDCPAFAWCPETTALIRETANPDALEGRFVELLNPETAEQARKILDRLEGYTKRMRIALQTFATIQPWETRPGYVYGPVEIRKDRLDGGIAAKTARELWGVEVGETRVTKGALEAAVRSVAPPRQGAAYLRKTLEAIGGAGGITVDRHVEVREHKVG